MNKSEKGATMNGCGFVVETWRGDRWGAVAFLKTWGEAEVERKRLDNLRLWDTNHRPRVTNAGN